MRGGDDVDTRVAYFVEFDVGPFGDVAGGLKVTSKGLGDGVIMALADVFRVSAK